MRKDSEKFLEIVLKERDKSGADSFEFDMDMFSVIPNYSSNARTILNDLKTHDCISQGSSIDLAGIAYIELTQDGIDYFSNKSDGQKISQQSNTINFYGDVMGMQLQQGTVNSTQTQTFEQYIDYDSIKEIVEEIRKYDKDLDDEFGDTAEIIRDKLNEIENLVDTKSNPSKLKQLLVELKNIAEGAVGSLIATGIVGLVMNCIG